MKAVHNIEPIYNKNSRILILGSMPSVSSREQKFYYAYKYNRFWPVLESLFGVFLPTVEDKRKFLLDNHIALWDVIASCDIKGSSDLSIKNIKVNDINGLIRNSNIQCVFCTGKTSYKLFMKRFKVSIPVICLPSPSSANAIYSIENLINEYKQILDYLPKEG